MANWDKLNKEFDQLIDNLSAEEWMIWAANKQTRKVMRRLEMEMKAKLQLEKIFLSNRVGSQILDNMPVSGANCNNSTFNFTETPVVAGENNYPLAA